MNRTRLAIAGILLVNLVSALLMYQTVGWYFIRGYNEVGNFVVAPMAFAQAGLNLLLAAPVVFVTRWRRSRGGRAVLASLVASSVVMFVSPVFAPIIGGVAKRNLWIETPIVEAARYGDAPLVITLLEKGADPNQKQRALGTTALHYMACSGELEAIEALISSGADPNARAKTSRQTPLHWAVRYRANVPTIELLMKHGANPNLKDWKDKTPGDFSYVIPEPRGSEIRRAIGHSPVRDSPKRGPSTYGKIPDPASAT